ncbi:protein phosphatase CheZ [Candidatus Chrysopegis kryptomonas]|uniref:Chemotaxis phosphatase, CheZ n=1 Tax=Candidatus Chryseopegocella kryptomonas TaxID=1633643 RepID=A0A0P1MRK7_9BACT|nr:protein phosphatase CheZ [Candidatus Chrysopegis kryptomonas]CUS98364.1 Chemotaxis phosphatase, CheZ [Candidatus Chrysopegis kryptomonas]
MEAKKESNFIKQIDFILREIEELKAIFILGQRVIPFLEELFVFVREVGPMLAEINKSLEESSNKIPRASNQLNTVTKTTEMATTEILDALDEMSLKFGEIKGYISAMKLCYQKQQKLARRIKKQIEKGDLESVKELWGKFYEVLSNCNGFDDVFEKLSEVKQNAENIMYALQFQDITAQQISAINYLIGSVQEKITHLLSKLGNTETRKHELETYSDFSEKSFNPSAEYDKSSLKQEIVDEIIKNSPKSLKTIDENEGIASQEEIDKLFNKDKNNQEV